MVVVLVVSLIGLAAVLFALQRDDPLPPAAEPTAGWVYLPEPTDIARSEFPMAFPGYDPAAVDAHLDAIARAWADLVAVAPREVIDRARVRVADRLGHGDGTASIGGEEDGPGAADPSAGTQRSSLTGTDATSDAEALRAEAALGGLDQADYPRGP